MTTTEQQIILILEDTVRRTQSEISGWALALQASPDPLYELSWSGDLYLKAATLKYAREALAFLKREVNPDFADDRIKCIREEWTRDVMQMAENIPSSTSKVSNLADEARRSAKTWLLRTYFRDVT